MNTLKKMFGVLAIFIGSILFIASLGDLFMRFVVGLVGFLLIKYGFDCFRCCH